MDVCAKRRKRNAAVTIQSVTHRILIIDNSSITKYHHLLLLLFLGTFRCCLQSLDETFFVEAILEWQAAALQSLLQSANAQLAQIIDVKLLVLSRRRHLLLQRFLALPVRVALCRSLLYRSEDIARSQSARSAIRVRFFRFVCRVVARRT